MSAKQIHVIELDNTENNLIKAAFLVAMGAITRDPAAATLGALGFRALAQRLGEEKYGHLIAKMDRHDRETAKAEGLPEPTEVDLPPELRAMLDTIGGTD